MKKVLMINTGGTFSSVESSRGLVPGIFGEQIIEAIHMALSDKKGVFVVFHHKIMLGCRTSKVRTVSFDAFESINYPQVGSFNAFGMQLNEEALPKQRGSFSFQGDYSDRIAVLKVFPGLDPDIFSYLYDKGNVYWKFR